MAKCFTNGQRIRHTIDSNKVVIGTYNSETNRIVLDDTISFKGPGGLSNYNYGPDSRMYGHSDGWGTCECEVEGKWISTFDLRSLV